MKMEHLEKIIDYTKSKERIEESKYFTKEFFGKYKIIKYRELIEKYEEIYFKSLNGTVYCKRKEDDEFIKEYSLYKLVFSDESIEVGKEFLKELDEENHILEYGENSDKEIEYDCFENNEAIYIGENENIFLDNDEEVWAFYQHIDEESDLDWDWIKLSDNFDKFMDELYYVEDKPKVEEHLEIIIDKENTTKRTKRNSKYFTKEFFETYEIKKYRNLFEEYEEIWFTDDGYCQIRKERDKFDVFVWRLTLQDEEVERGKNVLMEMDEYNHETSDNRDDEIKYEMTDDLFPIKVTDGGYIFISKSTKEVWSLSSRRNSKKEIVWEWNLFGNNFDDFIDRIYIVPPVEDEEFNEKVKKWYDKAFEVLSK
ncbi:hypothetical protein [Leptotrichia sp. oral taxon 221]|uniref:hypothetical protein n=1 Tax=Leptotrichia sp. oral taxon 221 TaxID=712362 RepID=UPI001B8B401E|nr:hypothetical protein [Leptotrichia sp. oral taxon 221]QUB96410.1 hypothetical protein J4863_04865 [Leptotrichia sp. oral taxon 221]